MVHIFMSIPHTNEPTIFVSIAAATMASISAYLDNPPKDIKAKTGRS
jgi:hypothetical protein